MSQHPEAFIETSAGSISSSAMFVEDLFREWWGFIGAGSSELETVDCCEVDPPIYLEKCAKNCTSNKDFQSVSRLDRLDTLKIDCFISSKFYSQ